MLTVACACTQNALVHDGLARGLRECSKALDKKQAHLCVLVETCTEGESLDTKLLDPYSQLIISLASCSRVPQAH